MGQQQLLLLVLGAIIVGIAIVVGINMFGESAVKAQEDAVRQDLLTMGARVQEWYRKPAQLGGGGKDFTSFVGFSQLGYRKDFDGTDATDAAYENENATFALAAPGTAAAVEITGTLKEDATLGIMLSIDPNATSPNILTLTMTEVAGSGATP